ncbi:hypothetical protein AUC43_11860 [Hymenobacter sedentarius]|uniref:Outer membrane protein beta-barrel domain-containing protein n=1 Tax=Hymenobacter sedentarius TaxID=1411621 RepID=A0A0U4BPP2_9BACT|nr:hypothetical protein [Hymenobacter sedentarius]ALW85722.1 hypothetical protein AUC43_11860 [Hymenobacter sedentarius]
MLLPLRFVTLLWLAALVPAGSWAQAPSPDSAVGRRVVPRIPHRRVVVQYDSRYSILNHHFTTINGLKLGVEFKNRFRAGTAIYFLSTGVTTRQARPENAAADAQADLRFRYLAGYGEYVLLETPRWELSSNLQLGLGSAYVRYNTPDGRSHVTPKQFMGVVEPSVSAHLRVFQWAGLGAGVGWRQPVLVSGAIQRELNGPVFYLRGKLFLGDLLKVVKNKTPLFTQEGLRKG